MILALLLAADLCSVSVTVDQQNTNEILTPNQPYTYFDGCNTCTCNMGGCNCTLRACGGTWWIRPQEPAPSLVHQVSCSDSLWKVVRESIDVLAGVKVRQSVVPTLRAAAEACE